MSVHKDMNNFPDELLLHLFKFVSSNQLVQLEIMNQQWKDCAGEVIAKRITDLRRQIDGNLKHFSLSKSSLLVPRKINKNHYSIVKNILSKCTNIKAMYLWGISVSGKYFLVSIAHLLPELEEICFNTNCKREHQRMFKYLKSFRNIKQLIWNNTTKAQMNHQNIFNVLQRVDHLEINSQFSIDLLDKLIILGQTNPTAKIRMIMRIQDEKFEESWCTFDSKYGQKFTTNNWHAIIGFGGDIQLRLEKNLNTEFI